jgi:small-conductance mechanosensitive channel
VKRTGAQVKSDQDMIDDLKKESVKAGPSKADEFQQQIDLLQAQLELDKDDQEDASGDLARSGVDKLTRIQRQFARYQAAQGQTAAPNNQALTLPPAEASVPAANLLAQFSGWRALRDKGASLQQARDEALEKHAQLQQKHDATEQASNAASATDEPETATAGSNGKSVQDRAVIAALQRLAADRKRLADLDKRIQDHQDLADTYGNWLGLVQAGKQALLHRILRSVLLILLIILAAYSIDLAVDHTLVGLIADRRRMRTLRTIAGFVVQATGALLILVVLIGVPNQMPTILGLAGAGLTVALKDFIVAFIGWFVLMGRNGIRVGDWVEIQGVVGEVAEIGLLRTVLLETGNWNDAGHPTGRKVAFVNSFAIEEHYFNFSTSGQWLWDELQILVPASENPYPILDAVQKLVTSATEANARAAEEEWQRATQRDHVTAVSAAPAINLRPTPAGVEVHVRYITRANDRYTTRAKLYQDIVALLHQWPTESVVAGGGPADAKK